MWHYLIILAFIVVMGYVVQYFRRNALQTAQTGNDPVTSEMKYAIEKYKLEKKSFTLVEVTMAIAVIAIGMMGIMALFPIGFQATRDAMGDNYSSDMADQFLHVIAMQCKNYKQGVKDGWGEWVKGNANPAWSNYNSSINQIAGKPLAADLEHDQVLKGLGVFGDSDNDGYDDTGLYFDDDTPGIFYVEGRSADIVDFNGVMALWTENITYPIDRDGDGKIEVSPGNDDDLPLEPIPYDIAAKLCVEISWPVLKPYASREKRYYVFEIFNPNSR